MRSFVGCQVSQLALLATLDSFLPGANDTATVLEFLDRQEWRQSEGTSREVPAVLGRTERPALIYLCRWIRPIDPILLTARSSKST
jgi:hypothetical protein